MLWLVSVGLYCFFTGLFSSLLHIAYPPFQSAVSPNSACRIARDGKGVLYREGCDQRMMWAPCGLKHVTYTVRSFLP
jgi:hypothetical protein